MREILCTTQFAQQLEKLADWLIFLAQTHFLVFSQKFICCFLKATRKGYGKGLNGVKGVKGKAVTLERKGTTDTLERKGKAETLGRKGTAETLGRKG